MDSLLSAAARALSAGDALGALKRVALRDDPPALAMRGIAMAQLGELEPARELLRRASRGFGAHESVARARCAVAQAEIALALRDLGIAPKALNEAATVLSRHGDHANAAQAHLIVARRAVLLGRLSEAGQALRAIESARLPPMTAAIAAMTRAELALRTLDVAAARAALDAAQSAATAARVPALMAEVRAARDVFARPAARLGTRLGTQGQAEAGPEDHALDLDQIAALSASDTVVVDACRHRVGTGDSARSLARRPVLFTLALALAEAWPGEADRDALIFRVFRLRAPDDTHRVRLRVEIGRLRALLRDVVRIEATPRGFAMTPVAARSIAVLLPPIDGELAALQALLADGAAWSTSALALAVGASQRTVQRQLAELEAQGRVRAVGRARAQRWLAPPLAGFTTILLLPAQPPID